MTWSREKLKKFYLHFNITYCSQTWKNRELGWETPSFKSRKRLTKWSRGYYLLNDIIKLILLSLMSVVLHFLDDKIFLMLSYLTFRSSPPEMFLGKGVQKIYSQFQNTLSQEHLCRAASDFLRFFSS